MTSNNLLPMHTIIANRERKISWAERLILQLTNPHLRENALTILAKKREICHDLAPLLWDSFGTIAALLQEITSIYKDLSTTNLNPAAVNRVCNALALLQCIASHPDTRMLFLDGIIFNPIKEVKYCEIVLFFAAHIPVYLYPFLNTTSMEKSFEFLRLTSLGVIGALVKVLPDTLVQVDDTEVITFLLSTEIIPICLRAMEIGSQLSKIVSDNSFYVLVINLSYALLISYTSPYEKKTVD
ncbi:hypothetical protein IFM89_027997 [Coptis chinensis]|uniref:Uncharacterized protein n=1 Tax=Coptis chinensis TaxID=261450 RepID=A0A835H181_9MAGN|nr:hypothetical protein IFM89_027997 [Coptis chinensis]